MSAFTLLWHKLLDSSIWVNESKETRLAWITLMAMKDENGIIQSSIVGLAGRARITPDEARAALKVFLSPDPDDSSGVDEGRRIRAVPGGWQIVNHDLYRFSTEAKREFWRIEKAAQREREKKALEARGKKNRKKHGALPGELIVKKMEDEGYSPHEVDAATTAALPYSEFPPQTGGIMTGQPPGRDIN